MIRFIAYSDIHHDEYNNGVTEVDVASVEDQITQYAMDNTINIVFFLGDWFRATNPTRSVIASAEACWKKRSDAGIKTIVLVGNHDRWTKSALSGHAFVSAGIFSYDLENVSVIEKPQPIIINNVEFFMIPSGYEYSDEVKNYQSTRDRFTTVMFHGLLAGSALVNGGSASSGVQPEVLRKLNANLIIGGDNHTHQRLDHILECPSLYVGATMQHSWGDRGQDRGFLDVTIADSGKFNFSFVHSKSPRFIRTKIPAINEMDAIIKIENALSQQLKGNAGIVEITLIGKNMQNIDIDRITTAFDESNIRRLRIIADKTFEKLEVAAGLSKAATYEEKWRLFVAGVDTKEFNPILLERMGQWAIQEAKRQY